MMPGMPERRTHDYLRNGITTLFAAFDIADGTVIGELHRQHRATRVPQVPDHLDKTVPADLRHPPGLRQLRHAQDPGGQGLAGRHPRFHLHFTPTGSSWINQVVRHEVA